MTRSIGLLVAALGAAVFILGWINEAEWMLSIFPHWVTMKASTSISFALLGIGIASASMHRERRHVAQSVTTVASAFVLILMFGLAIQAVTGFPIGFDTLFVREQTDRYSVGPGIPSLATIALNMLSALCLMCMSEASNRARCQKVSRVTASIVVGIAGIALLGYAVGVPALYWYIPDVSTAMAAHTAAGFIMVGVALRRLADRLE